MSMRISKTKFCAGVQCLKRLYLLVHSPELGAQPDSADQAIIEQGREVGLLARQLFPGGVEVRSEGGLGSSDPCHARASREPGSSGDLRRCVRARRRARARRCSCIDAGTVDGDSSKLNPQPTLRITISKTLRSSTGW